MIYGHHLEVCGKVVGGDSFFGGQNMKIKFIIFLFIISFYLIFIGCTVNLSDKNSNILDDNGLMEVDLDQETKNNILTDKSELYINNSEENSAEGYTERLLTIEDLSEAFYSTELHLKSQADDEFLSEFILNGVKPINYELLDDGLYIYIYKSQEDVQKGLRELKGLPYFQVNTEIYHTKNILIFYTISRGNELERDQYKLKIKQVMGNIDN